MELEGNPAGIELQRIGVDESADVIIMGGGWWGLFRRLS